MALGKDVLEALRNQIIGMRKAEGGAHVRGNWCGVQHERKYSPEDLCSNTLES
jgi:hypothetical protein